MELGDHIERRVERIQFETDRHMIVGNVTLPPEGYQSRFSDSLNRPDVSFIPVVDAEISPIDGSGPTIRHDFVVVAKGTCALRFRSKRCGERGTPRADRRARLGRLL